MQTYFLGNSNSCPPLAEFLLSFVLNTTLHQEQKSLLSQKLTFVEKDGKIILQPVNKVKMARMLRLKGEMMKLFMKEKMMENYEKQFVNFLLRYLFVLVKF